MKICFHTDEFSKSFKGLEGQKEWEIAFHSSQPPKFSILLFLLVCIGAKQLLWIMPIPFLGKNKTIGCCDIV